MATREFLTPVGSDLRDITGYTWQVAGIQIDNPSGSWLQVTGINQYVPPYTLGWSYPIVPTQTSVSVLFVDSPSGSPSERVGDPVTVRLSSTPFGQSPGFASGAAQSQSPIGARTQYISQVLEVIEGGTSLNIAVGANEQLVPLRAILSFIVPNLASYYSLINGGPAVSPLMNSRGIVSVISLVPIGSVYALRFTGTISPQTPSVEYLFPPGSQENESVSFVFMSEPGAGKQTVHFLLEYYMQRERQ